MVPAVIEGDNRRISGGGPPDNDVIIARDEHGRFRPGVSASPQRRFTKGRSGNPAGRPKGSFRAGARAALAMFDAASPRMAEKLIELGDGGDGVSARFCLARTVGTRRGQPIELDLPAIAAPGDLGSAVGAVAAAVGDGSITPEEAMHLARMLDGFPRIFAAVPPPEEGASPEQASKARHSLIEALDRIADSYTDDEHRAMLEAELAERRARRERLAAKEAAERGAEA